MNRLVSICIPSYNRPDFTLEAVASALAQSYPAVEIIVSDDSSDDRTQEILADLVAGGRVRYVRNRPALGQARNVNQCFDLAQGDRLILLHDDDLLLPDAVAGLAACFDADPTLTAAFGKQYIIDPRSKVDEAASEQLNIDYRRTPHFAGRQASCLLSALTSQFPNDCYMVLTAAARQVRCRDIPEVGYACDFDFGLRLGGMAEGFYFLDRYTAKFRIVAGSQSAGNNYTNVTYDLIANVDLPPDLEPTRRERLRRYAVPAVSRWLEMGRRRSALRVYTSAGYGWKQRFTKQGLVHALLLLCPAALCKRLLAARKQRLISRASPAPNSGNRVLAR